MFHVFMHNDADGFASGYQIIKHLKETVNIKKDDYQYHIMDYSKKFPFDLIKPEDIIFIVDYSIEPEEMIKLLDITKDVIWIDHHISAIEKYSNSNLDLEDANYIDGLRVNGLSGCALTWIYCNLNWSEMHKHQFNTDKDFLNALKQDFSFAPIWLRLINDWDIWEHKIPETKPFMIALNNILSIETIQKLDEDSVENTPIGECQIDRIDRTKFLKDLIETGNKYIDYRNHWASQLRDRYGYDTNIVGPDNKSYSMYLLNLGNANSEYFGDKIDEYDIVTTFCFNGIKYNYSMYSNKDYVNCAELCRYFGVDNGGGHKGAAGFTNKDLLFTKLS